MSSQMAAYSCASWIKQFRNRIVQTVAVASCILNVILLAVHANDFTAECKSKPTDTSVITDTPATTNFTNSTNSTQLGNSTLLNSTLANSTLDNTTTFEPIVELEIEDKLTCLSPNMKILIIAAGIAILLAPLVIYQECKLEDIDSLREVQNELRSQANDMNEKNARLASQANRLQGEVKALAGCEAELAKLAEKAGQDMNYLVELVEEYKRLNAIATKIIEADIQYRIIDVIRKADRDGDMSIDQSEIKYLTRNLRFDERYTFNEKLFVERVKADPTLKGILNNVKDLKREDLPDEERTFIRKNKMIRS